MTERDRKLSLTSVIVSALVHAAIAWAVINVPLGDLSGELFLATAARAQPQTTVAPATMP